MERNNLGKDDKRNNNMSLENEVSKNIEQKRVEHYFDEAKSVDGMASTIFGSLGTLTSGYLIYMGLLDGGKHAEVSVLGGLIGFVMLGLTANGISDIYKAYTGKDLL